VNTFQAFGRGLAPLTTSTASPAIWSTSNPPGPSLPDTDNSQHPLFGRIAGWLRVYQEPYVRMHERGAPAVGRAAPDAGELVSARGRARAAHGAAPPRSAAASMGSPVPGPPPPRSARSRSVRYRADERPRIRVLPDVDFPVTQPRELQTQQQGAAEHAVRPTVDDDLLLLRHRDRCGRPSTQRAMRL
jgi:hypothetical protein